MDYSPMATRGFGGNVDGHGSWISQSKTWRTLLVLYFWLEAGSEQGVGPVVFI